MVFVTAVGAALGTAKAGIGIAGLGTFKPELIMRVCNGSPCNDCILLMSIFINLVSHSSRHVWNHSGIWTSCLSSHCRRTCVTNHQWVFIQIVLTQEHNHFERFQSK